MLLELRITLRRVAVAAAARGADADRVTFADADVLRLGEMWWRLPAAVPIRDLDLIDGTVLAAEHALWAEAAVVHDEAGIGDTPPERHGVAEPHAAAVGADEDWNRTRKALRKKQHAVDIQQTY